MQPITKALADNMNKERENIRKRGNAGDNVSRALQAAQHRNCVYKIWGALEETFGFEEAELFFDAVVGPVEHV